MVGVGPSGIAHNLLKGVWGFGCSATQHFITVFMSCLCH